ncbi:unnamed protein product [Thlaspi arvense]|uniref:DUF8040 domain-containing protein n=1 Tax=Thlaspi arvense TaxID=13288 RepID=A0AAU9STQ6_THLAR|nr:unnamed protein product [Thlaspi arvense]
MIILSWKNTREEEAIQIEDDESDLDIMLLMLDNIARATVKDVNRIERPLRRPITNIGYAYIQKALKEEPEHFRSLYRMYPTSFEKLCDLIRTKTSLQDTRNICVEEMVATFLLTIGQSSKCCYTIDTFKRSVFATNENFHKVLKASNTMAPDLMARPGVTTCAKIRESTRFYPYFKLVLACAGLHNFLRQQCRSDAFLEEVVNVNNEKDTDSEENGNIGILDTQQREYANNWRNEIASKMWADAVGTGSQR